MLYFPVPLQDLSSLCIHLKQCYSRGTDDWFASLRLKSRFPIAWKCSSSVFKCSSCFSISKEHRMGPMYVCHVFHHIVAVVQIMLFDYAADVIVCDVA